MSKAEKILIKHVKEMIADNPAEDWKPIEVMMKDARWNCMLSAMEEYGDLRERKAKKK